MAKTQKLRVDHGPVDEDIVDSLTEAEKAWLRSWNRGNEIPDEEADATNADDEDSEEDYDSWNNDALRAELERRGLPKSGNHDELVARLEEDDDSDEE